MLLSGHINDQRSIGTAARFAYAFHNAALAVLHDQPVDVERTLANIAGLESELGEEYIQHIRKQVSGDVT